MENPAYWLGGPPGPTETVSDAVNAIRNTMPLGDAQGDAESGKATNAKHGAGNKKPKA